MISEEAKYTTSGDEYCNIHLEQQFHPDNKGTRQYLNIMATGYHNYDITTTEIKSTLAKYNNRTDNLLEHVKVPRRLPKFHHKFTELSYLHTKEATNQQNFSVGFGELLALRELPPNFEDRADCTNALNYSIYEN